MSIASLEAVAPHLPQWAAGMVEVSAGLKRMDVAKFESAALSFRRYLAFQPDTRQRWAFMLQPLAEKLAVDCETAAWVLKEVDDLSREGKYEAALAAVRVAEAGPVLASLQGILHDREMGLQTALARQEQEAVSRQEESKKREQ